MIEVEVHDAPGPVTPEPLWKLNASKGSAHLSRPGTDRGVEATRRRLQAQLVLLDTLPVIVAREGTGEIVAGEAVYWAYVELGLARVPVRWVP